MCNYAYSVIYMYKFCKKNYNRWEFNQILFSWSLRVIFFKRPVIYTYFYPCLHSLKTHITSILQINLYAYLSVPRLNFLVRFFLLNEINNHEALRIYLIFYLESYIINEFEFCHECLFRLDRSIILFKILHQFCTR